MKRLLTAIAMFVVCAVSYAQTTQQCYEWQYQGSLSGQTKLWHKTPAAAAAEHASDYCAASPSTVTACSVSQYQVAGTFPTYSWVVSFTQVPSGNPGLTTQTTTSTRQLVEGCAQCPPSGTKRIVGWNAPAGSSCLGSCMWKVPTNTLTITANGASHGLREAESEGRACSSNSAGADLPPPPDDKDCMSVPGIGFVCADTEDNDCGYVNGDRVCPDDVSNDNCVGYSSGAVACGPDADSPPAPNNGTDGNIPPPDVTIINNGGDTINYYNNNTVDNSSQPPQTDPPQGGNPIGGDGDDGGCEGEDCGPGEEGSVTGGLTCTSAPVCEGDALQCAAIQQQWRTRCVENPLDAELESAYGPTLPTSSDDVVPESTFEMPEALNATGWISDTCPSDIPINLGSQLGSVEIPISEWCNWFSIFGVMIMVSAYLAGIRIVMGGL